MSNLSRFMKNNKVQRTNAKYAPTKSLVDEKGVPVEFEFQPISSKTNNELRDSCTIDVPITGKPGAYRPKTDTAKYLSAMIVASTVEPDLYNKDLQDSYGVKTPEDLLYAMIDNPGEYQDLCTWIQKYQGFDTLDEKREQAKN